MNCKKLLLPMFFVLLSAFVLPVRVAIAADTSVGDTITELCVRLVNNSQLYYAVSDDFRILFQGDSVSFVESTGRNTIYSNEIVSYTYRKRIAVVHVDSTVCENALPLTWNGTTFTGAGTQSATFTASTGADSTVVMTLAVIPTVYESYYDTVLASQLPHVYNGEIFNGPATTTFTFTSSAGCDSVLNYNLYVIDDVSVTDFQQEHFRFSFNGQQITIVCDDADALVSLYSVNGQLLKRERVLSGATASISLYGYASGFYVLQVNGKSYKIVKQ